MYKNNGLIYIFTGNGKGKTSAAIGSAVRMSEAGKKVGFFQFLKTKNKSSESSFLGNNKLINHKQFGVGFFRSEEQRESQVKAAKDGFEYIGNELNLSKYDLVILDEINVAIKMELIELDLVMNLLNKRKDTHFILTGRYAPEKLIEIADLVTEMKEIKHPYQKGIKPVKGIDL